MASAAHSGADTDRSEGPAGTDESHGTEMTRLYASANSSGLVRRSAAVAANLPTDSPPPSCQPIAPLQSPNQLPMSLGATRINMPPRQLRSLWYPPRRKFALPGGVGTLYAAGDWYVGAGLFVMIFVLGVIFFAAAVPAIDRAIWFTQQPLGRDASGALQPLPRHWLWEDTHPVPTTGAVVAGGGDDVPGSTAESGYIQARHVRDASVTALKILLALRGAIVPICGVLVALGELQLLALLFADPGFESNEPTTTTHDDEEDTAEQQAAAERQREEDEAVALVRMPPLPAHFTADDRTRYLEQCIDTVVREREYIETMERDVHKCPVCRYRVLGYDHHCGVIGACIGRRTMPLFVLFLITTASLLLLAQLIVLPLVILFAIHGMIVHFPPSVVAIAVIGLSVAALYLGLYTFCLGIFYSLTALRGDFSLGRRRRAAVDEAARNGQSTAAMGQYDATQLCGKRPCRLGHLLEMLSPLRELRLARK
jgi:hypothetical protein